MLFPLLKPTNIEGRSPKLHSTTPCWKSLHQLTIKLIRTYDYYWTLFTRDSTLFGHQVHNLCDYICDMQDIELTTKIKCNILNPNGRLCPPNQAQVVY